MPAQERIGLFARYARIEVAAIALSSAALTIAAGWWFGAWGLLPAAVGAALLSFYRDPPRRVPIDASALLAPADGRVVRVERGVTTEGIEGPALRIVIFLSVFNVHVNRAPCAGRVQRIAYRRGRFHSALAARATDENECNTLWLAPADARVPGPVVVRQIAGLLARRIVCTLSEGEPVAQGQRIGMIKLGSQTELVLPDDARWRVHVRPGAAVRAGVTRLASLEPVAPLA